MSKRLGLSISINCSSCGVLLVCSGQYQKWPKEETMGNQQQGHGWMRLIDARDERRFAHVVPSNRVTIAEIGPRIHSASQFVEYGAA